MLHAITELANSHRYWPLAWTTCFSLKADLVRKPFDLRRRTESFGPLNVIRWGRSPRILHSRSNKRSSRTAGASSVLTSYRLEPLECSEPLWPAGTINSTVTVQFLKNMYVFRHHGCSVLVRSAEAKVLLIYVQLNIKNEMVVLLVSRC